MERDGTDRDTASNVVGLKVSDTPWERFAEYLLPGFDIFVGPEALIAQGMANGAIGAVSALASAFPADVTAVVRDPSPEGAAHLGEHSPEHVLGGAYVDRVAAFLERELGKAPHRGWPER